MADTKDPNPTAGNWRSKLITEGVSLAQPRHAARRRLRRQ